MVGEISTPTNDPFSQGNPEKWDLRLMKILKKWVK